MPQYMLILGGTDAAMVKKNRDVAMAKYAAWTEQLARSGALKDAHKLKDGTGRRLSMKGDQIIDGPFAETKETVGGYYLITVADEAAAAAVAKECPVLEYQGGYVEVREIER